VSLDRLDAFRRSVSFKWWLVYDVLIAFAVVRLFIVDENWWTLVLPVALTAALAFSALLDVIEFFVKRRMERDVDEFNRAWDREHKARKRA
jgi:hypothetical protein